MPESAYLLPLYSLLGLPFLVFLILWLGGKRLNTVAGWIGALVTAIGLVISLLYAEPGTLHTVRLDWVQIGDLNIELSFRFDTLSNIMLVVVHCVAFLVQVYSSSYLSHDKGLYRYFAFLQLFLFSMIGIILSGNLLMMYIFWELVGLCSYLLIGFWYIKPRAVWAAQKAFVLNRIGDAAFLTGILLLFYYIGSTDFEVLALNADALSPAVLTGIGLCLFGGCMGKSAQFPLSGWLPDAMEGPTPVSALIHAATMVAAGIFLMARISFLLTFDAKLVIIMIGTITMLIGAVKATQVWDIKRVLAYSTMSQLGLMVVAIGFGSWHTAIFHLTTHAFFKAGLFLCAGSVIHAITPDKQEADFDPQDMRTMGGLAKSLPITFACFLLCAAALAGLPLFSGFLSKDAIIAEGFLWAGQNGFHANIFPILLLLSAGLTAYYMCRQIWMVFLGEMRYQVFGSVHPHESPIQMWAPMVILSVFSAFIWFSWNPFHPGTSWYLFLLGKEESAHISWLPYVAGTVSALAILLALRQIRSKNPFQIYSGDTSTSWLSRIPVPEWTADFSREVFFLKPFNLVTRISKAFERHVIDALVGFVAKASVVAAHLTSWFDKNMVDGGVHMAVFTVRSSGQAVRKIQNGKIQSYFLAALLGIFCLIVWLLVL
jgi:NADH-quinone oxidoreductase subunit L